MQIERAFMNATELRQSGFRNRPEVLNAVNMVRTMSEFILSMLNPVMFLIAKIDKAIIGLKSVGIHHRFFADLVPDDWQKLCNRTISDHLGVDVASPLDQAENDVLPSRAATADTANTASTKVAFIDFNLTSFKGTFGLAELGNSVSNSLEHPVYRRATHPGQRSYFRRFYIKRKIPYNLSKFLLRNFGMKYILVSHCSKIT